MEAARGEPAEVRDAVRASVRALLEETPAFAQAAPEERRALAHKLVNVGLLAARLAHADDALTREIGARAAGRPAQALGVPAAAAAAPRAPGHTPIARAQSASDQLGMAAVRQAGGTIQSLRDSVGFPEFVQSLITGTFQAILTSSTAQLGSLGELLDNVAATSDEFSATVGDGEIRQWAVRKFPFLTLQDGAVVMRDPDQSLYDLTAQLTGGLSATPDEIAGIDPSDLETTLLPLVRRKIARDKQGILATLVQLGLQRIVVDEGRLEASMDLRVDAQSASQETQAALDSLAINAGAAANMSFGPVGASAYASTSIGRVRSDVQQTSEQIAARAGLRSSVQLAFRTEQVPLDRMANEGARVRIAQNARVPDVAEKSILDTLQPLAPVRPAPAAPPAPPSAPRPPPAAPPSAPRPPPAAGTAAPPATAGTAAPPATAGTAAPPAPAGTAAPPATAGTAAPPAPAGTAAPPATAGTAAPPAPARTAAPPAPAGTAAPPAPQQPQPGAPAPAPAAPASGAPSPGAPSLASLIPGAASTTPQQSVPIPAMPAAPGLPSIA